MVERHDVDKWSGDTGMSQTMQPAGQPMPPQGMMPPGGPGMGQALPSAPPSGAPQGIAGPPAPQPNPAFAAWMQANQQRQQIIAQNAQKQAQFDAACALIRTDGIRGFKLDIEADSTIAPDEQAEKQSRIEFLQQIVPFMEQITPIAQGSPEMSELMSEIAMFAVRGFRVARTLEESFEKAFKVLGTMPKPPPKGQGAQQNPQVEMAKVQADVQDTQAKTQASALDTQGKMQIAQATLAQKTQQANQEMTMAQMRFQAEQEHNAAQLAMENEKMHSTERLQGARMLNTEARGTGGLV